MNGARLFWTVIAATPALAGPAVAATAQDGFVRVRPQDVVWTDVPEGRGVRAATILGDPTRPGTYVIRVRFPPHVMDLPHSHSGGDRYVTVLEGRWCTGTGVRFDPAKTIPLGPGSVMKHPSGAVHWDGSCGDAPVVVQIIGTGPTRTTPVDPRAPQWVEVGRAR